MGRRSKTAKSYRISTLKPRYAFQTSYPSHFKLGCLAKDRTQSATQADGSPDIRGIRKNRHVKKGLGRRGVTFQRDPIRPEQVQPPRWVDASSPASHVEPNGHGDALSQADIYIPTNFLLVHRPSDSGCSEGASYIIAE